MNPLTSKIDRLIGCDPHTLHNAFLCRPHEVSLAMLVEVDTLYGASHFFVLQHTLGTISKRYDGDTFATDRH